MFTIINYYLKTIITEHLLTQLFKYDFFYWHILLLDNFIKTRVRQEIVHKCYFIK